MNQQGKQKSIQSIKGQQMEKSLSQQSSEEDKANMQEELNMLTRSIRKQSIQKKFQNNLCGPNKQKKRKSNTLANESEDALSKNDRGLNFGPLKKYEQPHELKKSFVRKEIINYSLENGKKVFMSGQDIAKLKKLKLENQKRQKEIKKKIVEHQNEVLKAKTEVVQKEKQQRQESMEKRKKKIEQKQKSLEKQRQNKVKRFEEQNKRLKELKKQKKLFQKMQQQFLKTQQLKKNQIENLTKSRSAYKTINYDSIREHQRQFLAKNQQQIQNSRLKIKNQIKQLQKEFQSLNLHKSRFHEQIKKQKQQRLFQAQAQQRRKKIYSQKIKQYMFNVKQNHKPLVKVQEKTQTPKKKPVQFKQLHNLGNQYMKQSKLNIDRNKENLVQEQMKQHMQEQINKRKNTYKDYLKQNRSDDTLKKMVKSHHNDGQKMRKQLQKINKIENPQQKAEMVRLLEAKIQQNVSSQVSKKKKLKLESSKSRMNSYGEEDVEKLKAKFQILQQLQQNRNKTKI